DYLIIRIVVVLFRSSLHFSRLELHYELVDIRYFASKFIEEVLQPLLRIGLEAVEKVLGRDLARAFLGRPSRGAMQQLDEVSRSGATQRHNYTMDAFILPFTTTVKLRLHYP